MGDIKPHRIMNDLFQKTVARAKSIVTIDFVVKLLLVFLAYFLTAKGGLALNNVAGFATLVWPPTGIALAALLVFGVRFWPAIFIAAFVVNLSEGALHLVALGIATGNTGEALLAAYLLQRAGFNLNLETIKDGLLLICYGAFANSVLGATVGTTSLLLGGIVTPETYSSTWLTWWIGDVLGTLIVGNLLLNIRKLLRARNTVHPKILEVVAFATTLSLFCTITFLQPSTPSFGIPTIMASLVFLISPLLIWAALRFGTIGSSFAIFAISVIAILGTALGKGPFVGGALNENLLQLQIFMGSVAITTMILAKAAGEIRATGAAKLPISASGGVARFPTGNEQGYLIKKQTENPVASKLLFVLAGFICISGILISLSYFSMQTLTSIRAYVAGEGLWSKAVKDAAYQLHVYALSHNEADFNKFEGFIAVPLGDKIARTELQKTESDLEVADRGFIAGRNHPEDVRNMSLLFRRFNDVSYMKKAILLWEEGDARIALLIALGDKLHAAVQSETSTTQEIRDILLEIDEINSGLTVLEDEFSYTLGEAARWLTNIFIIAMLVVAAILVIPGVAVAAFVIRNIARLDRAKTEFISLTSHQLRTPPTGIKWYAGMLLEGDLGELPPAQRTYVEQIAYNNQRMIDIVDSVLEISQIELGVFKNKPTHTDICALIQKIFSELDFQLHDKELVLSQRLECGPRPIAVDPTLVRIVVQNLLVNSVKYTPRGGEISFSANVSGSKLTITIADTGPGIPKQDVPHIFNKFYRASNARRPEYQGTGLGLYVVKRILDQIGGNISFQSELGKGTTFFVTIPVRTIT